MSTPQIVMCVLTVLAVGFVALPALLRKAPAAPAPPAPAAAPAFVPPPPQSEPKDHELNALRGFSELQHLAELLAERGVEPARRGELLDPLATLLLKPIVGANP